MLPSSFRLGLGMAMAALVACAAPSEQGNSSDHDVAAQSSKELVFGRKSTRIAIVGAGASGLSAANTLESLGYEHVTVFEKNDRVGGKVYSYRNGKEVSELGAVFASPEYQLVLGLAAKYGIPYTEYDTAQFVVNEQGQKQTAEDFLKSKYSQTEILAAAAAYLVAQGLFVQDQLPGFAHLPPDLYLPFDQFAAKYHFTPIAEAVRAVMVGFGYGYYENTPAMYYMKLVPWLIKVGGTKGLIPATYYTFPTGYQSIWEAVADDLNDVHLNSEVTRIVRNEKGKAPIQLTVNGNEHYDFDYVVISAPLNKVSSFMALEEEEADLFSRVKGLRYFVSLFGASGLSSPEVDFFHNNARPSGIDHVDVWASRAPGAPFVGYQIAQPETSLDDVTSTLASDVASQGGTFGGLFLRQEWENYYPHVSVSDAQARVYDRIEALQGKKNTFYVGGSLSFETVEHSARYADVLMRLNFFPVFF
jgi:oxygen-dependent protoporphyrinogen oxidase